MFHLHKQLFKNIFSDPDEKESGEKSPVIRLPGDIQDEMDQTALLNGLGTFYPKVSDNDDPTYYDTDSTNENYVTDDVTYDVEPSYHGENEYYDENYEDSDPATDNYDTEDNSQNQDLFYDDENEYYDVYYDVADPTEESYDAEDDGNDMVPSSYDESEYTDVNYDITDPVGENYDTNVEKSKF